MFGNTAQMSAVPLTTTVGVEVDSEKVVRKLPQPTAAHLGPLFTSALSPADTTIVSDYNPMANGIPVISSGGGLGSANLQTLATMQAMSGLPDAYPRRRLRRLPNRLEADPVEEESQKPYLLYGAYAAAAAAVLGLGYVAFGRRKKPGAVANPGHKFYLNVIPIDRQGYDQLGRYWAVGAPLFQYECSTDNSIFGEVRAASRSQAKAKIKKLYPGAKFFR